MEKRITEQTAEDWLKEFLEFHLCDECGKDAEDHEVSLVLGNYFAWCLSPPREDEQNSDHTEGCHEHPFSQRTIECS